jgi:hypothetical protein
MKKLLFTFLLLGTAQLFAQGGGGLIGPIPAVFPNDPNNPAQVGQVAFLNSLGNAQVATTSTGTAGVYPYCVSGVETSPSTASIAIGGFVSCFMDATLGPNITGYWVVVSSTTGGYAHPQAAEPTGGQGVIGQLVSTSTTAGNLAVVLAQPNIWTSGSGIVYPGPGIPCSTGTAWCPSYTVGNSGSDIPQLASGLLNPGVIPNNAANTTGTSNNALAINGVTVTGTPGIGYLPTATSSTAARWQSPPSGTLPSGSQGELPINTSSGSGSVYGTTSSGQIFISAFAGASADAQWIAAQTLSFAGAHLVSDLTGDQMILAHPILDHTIFSSDTVPGGAPNFQGKIEVRGPARFHVMTADSIVVPGLVNLEGDGNNGTTPTAIAGVIFQACNNATGQSYSGCSSALPNNTETGSPGVPMIICHASCSETKNVQGFETLISHIEIDANNLSGTIAYHNWAVQEDSGLDWVEIVNYGAGSGIGISLGKSSGGGGSSVNSAYSHLNMGNRFAVNCSASLAILIGNGGAPKEIRDVSVVNTNCSTVPNYLVEVTGASSYIVNLENFHLESFAVAGIYFSEAAATSGVIARNINACCDAVSNTAAVILVAAGAAHTHTFENIVPFAGGGTSPANSVVDSTNGCSIVGAVTRYELGPSGTITMDSSGTCPFTFAGFQNTAYNQNTTSVYSNATSTPSTVFTYTFPPNVFSYTLHCSGQWNASTTSTGLALSVIFGTTGEHALATSWVTFDNHTTTALISTGSSGAITGTSSAPIVTSANAQSSSGKYPFTLDVTAEIPVAGSTMAIQAADTDNSSTVQIARDFACK